MQNYNDDFIAVAERLDGEIDEITTDFDAFVSENKDRIYSRLYEFYRPIWEAVELLGWCVERSDNEVILSNYSPAGEELNETLYLDGKEDIPRQLYDIYDNFNEEEHVVMWVDAKRNGTSGVPSVIRLVKDAEDITEMYSELFTAAYENYSLCKVAE